MVLRSFSVGIANVPMDAFRVPLQGPGGDTWDSRWPCNLSSEGLLIMEPSISVGCLILLTAVPGPTWHRGWKDTRSTPTLRHPPLCLKITQNTCKELFEEGRGARVTEAPTLVGSPALGSAGRKKKPLVSVFS